jgi:hypothetical protein
MTSTITEIMQRKPLSTVLREIQCNTCGTCHKPLGDNFSITRGRIFHDVCPANVSCETLADEPIKPRTCQPRKK